MEQPMMNQSPPRRKLLRAKGELAVVFVCAILGFLLAAQLKTIRLTSAADATTASRLETLQTLYNELTSQNEGLQQQLEQTQGELALYREQAATGGESSQALMAEIDLLQVLAGLVDVEGPG